MGANYVRVVCDNCGSTIGASGCDCGEHKPIDMAITVTPCTLCEAATRRAEEAEAEVWRLSTGDFAHISEMLEKSNKEVERLHKLCHRAAKHLATSNRLSDLVRGDSEASKLYVDLVSEVHLGDGRESTP